MEVESVLMELGTLTLRGEVLSLDDVVATEVVGVVDGGGGIGFEVEADDGYLDGW